MATEFYLFSAFVAQGGTDADLFSLEMETRDADPGLDSKLEYTEKTPAGAPTGVTFTFEPALTAPEQTALDAVVAAHLGTVTTPAPPFEIVGTPINGQLYVYDSGATPEPGFINVTMSGDTTIDETGAVTIEPDSVTYDKMQNVVGNDVILGNIAGAGSPVAELTGTQVTAILDAFTDVLAGVVPASGGGTTNFLRADGTWATPVGSGDVSGPGSSTDTAIALWDGATGTLLQDSLILVDGSGNLTTPGTIDGLDVGALDTDLETFSLPANTTISTFGASLVDDADQATAQATLGVDPAGTDNSTDVTLAGTGTYITLGASQVITVDPIELTDINATLDSYGAIQGDTGTTLASSTFEQVRMKGLLNNGGIEVLATNSGTPGLDQVDFLLQIRNLTAGGVLATTDEFAVDPNGTNVKFTIQDIIDLVPGEVNDLTAAVTWANIPDANVPASAVTQHVALIDHDALLNFVANEHLDWTADQGANNINDANIVASSVTQHVGSIDHDALLNYVANEHFADAPADAQNYVRNNNAWVVAAGGGDVVGPGSSTDNQVVRFDGATGTLIQGETAGVFTYDDSGVVTIEAGVAGHVIFVTNTTASGEFFRFIGSGSNGAMELNANGSGGGVLRVLDGSVTEIPHFLADGGGATHVDVTAAGMAMDFAWPFSVYGAATGNGMRVMAGEVDGDITLHLADQDDSLTILEVHADNGQFCLGKTYAQTVIDNAVGDAYGIDNQHDSGVETDFNTLAGQYRMDEIPIPLKIYDFYADQVEYTVGGNWNVNVGAPASADSNNDALTVRLFDDTVDEAIGFIVKVPVQAQEMIVTTHARRETGTAAQNAIMVLHDRSIGNAAAVGAWGTNALTTIALPANENFVYDETSNTLAGWGLTAGEIYQMQLSRDANAGGDTLVGDLALLSVTIEFR